MFSLTWLTSDYYGPTINYKSQNGVSLSFYAEEREAMASVDLDCPTGGFDARPGNGSFAMSWGPDQVEFEVGKFGSGICGSLVTTIDLTPESSQSLKEVLRQWKAAYAHK